MYKIAEIMFTPLISDKKEALDLLSNVLCLLYKNGQILLDWMVEDHNDYFIARVFTTDDDSLDEKYYNRYIKRDIANFKTQILSLHDDAYATDCCHHEEHSYYILAIDPYDASSPVICGDCGKEIPLYKLPYLDDEEQCSILNFQRLYKSVDNLWMESLSDRFSKRQITDHNSGLNRRGLELANELEQKTGKMVYYLLCNPIGGWFEFEKNNKSLDVCPKCNGELHKFNHSFTDKVCHACRLAFITHEEE